MHARSGKTLRVGLKSQGRRAWDYLFKRQRGIRVENEIT